MSPRVRRARMIAMAAMGVGILAAAPVIGWPMVPMFVLALMEIGTMDRRIARSERPERTIARTFVFLLFLTATSAALTGGPTSPVLPLLVVPVALASARFRGPVVWAGAAMAGALALAVWLSSGFERALDNPLMLIGVDVLLVAVTAATTALMDAEFEFRTQSVLDPLTGMLNRGGLETRFVEIAAQARLFDQPVCVILCDLDHFKTVNDSFGHERGDAVLREVSYEMRKSLRSFELFYRVGGEEFLVLLPGVELAGGLNIAQNMRTAVEGCKPGGIDMTCSFGVSVARGNAIDFRDLYRAADENLYRSKDAGRNRVSAAGATFPPPEPALRVAEPAA